jgi:HK97 gp10 family phage protein
MPRVQTAELTGFKELEQALRALPKATGKNSLRRVARGALEPMALMASARAPHRSGRLAYSISVSEKRTRRARKSTTRYVGGGLFRAEASKGIEMAMGPGAGLGTLNYAAFDEFGTIDTPAFGFMRAAWDGGAYDALEYVKMNLSVEIDKATARFVKKQARLGL